MQRMRAPKEQTAPRKGGTMDLIDPFLVGCAMFGLGLGMVIGTFWNIFDEDQE